MASEPEKLKREAAGRYASADGRFSVEQSSGGWVAIDAETTDDLGLPLVRGPFATLDDARVAVADARTGPKATSNLADRLKGAPKPRTRTAAKPSAPKAPAKPREPEIEVREYRPSDGDALRDLWKAAGLNSVGDDDRSLAMFAERNPGLLLVASAGDRVIGSALGGWDGRRGWLYHLAVAEPFRRKGVAKRLVRRVEQRLRAVGAPGVRVNVSEENRAAVAFWAALGYERSRTRQLRRDF